MHNQLTKWTQRIQISLFHFGVIILPLAFSFKTEELFEFNKMLLVYLWATLVGGLWVVDLIINQKTSFLRSPFNWALFIFVLTQMLATVFSIHPYTSVFGYYSRFHGGLLSIFSYSLLLLSFANTFAKLPLKSLYLWLMSVFVGGFLATAYALPEHFGHSPSCLIVTGQFDANCWVQDVQNRIFGTFGQPNWLAAYLIMLITISISILWYLPIWKNNFTKSKAKLITFTLIFFNTILLLTLLFTKSRSGLLGLVIGLAVTTLLIIIRTFRQNLLFDKSSKKIYSLVGITTLVTGLITLAIGTPISPNISQIFNQKHLAESASSQESSTPALESGGTESGEIRKIVWKGALKVWQRYPIFGSGLETFAYTYYADRPQEHNAVSEWDFLYNKAHNEFLNILATSGIVGLAGYLIIVIAPFYLGIKLIWNKQSKITLSELDTTISVIIPGILGGLTALHVSNFFGFSTVTVTVLQFLWTGIVVILWFKTSPSGEYTNVTQKTSSKHSRSTKIVSPNIHYWQWLLLTGLGIFCLVIVYQIYSIRKADIIYAKSKNSMRTGQFSKASDLALQAIKLRPQESLYYASLGRSYAELTNQLAGQNMASEAASLLNQTELLLKTADQLNPYHYSQLLGIINAYLLLGEIDSKFLDLALVDLDRAQLLSPNDPRPHLLRARIYQFQNQLELAKEELIKVVTLKPDYFDGQFDLIKVAIQLEEWELAQQHAQFLIELDPNNSMTQSFLDQIDKKQPITNE